MGALQNEVEVYVTPDGVYRAAIVRRDDGLFCIYRHARSGGSWLEDDNAALLRYDDPNPEEIAQPEIGIYGTVADARNEIRSFLGFLHSVLLKPAKP
jgi:hypothetical protein